MLYQTNDNMSDDGQMLKCNCSVLYYNTGHQVYKSSHVEIKESAQNIYVFFLLCHKLEQDFVFPFTKAQPHAIRVACCKEIAQKHFKNTFTAHFPQQCM